MNDPVVARLRAYWLAATEPEPSLERKRFIWMNAVEQDTRLTEAQRLILTSCARINVLGGEVTFSLRQETVAERLGVQRQTVGRALAKARELGWLQLVEVRQRGRGWHKGDVHELTVPTQIGSPERTYSGEEYVRSETEICSSPRTYSEEYVRSETEICSFDARQNSDPPAQTDTLKGVDKGYKELQGCIAQGAARENETGWSDNDPIFNGLFEHQETTMKALPASTATGVAVDDSDLSTATQKANPSGNPNGCHSGVPKKGLSTATTGVSTATSWCPPLSHLHQVTNHQVTNHQRARARENDHQPHHVESVLGVVDSDRPQTQTPATVIQPPLMAAVINPDAQTIGHGVLAAEVKDSETYENTRRRAMDELVAAYPNEFSA
ncbi:helix-turn-helix domain-containing protein [Mycobacterium paraense]|uniref:helix-turn-helix domain-containing protein n=1 Tax=Mycobacterium paraense TaxID=767916 RepID=UPI00111C88EA|nr:helix-turn-helix domain-containing protein [Mycobacterium paraense]